MSQLYKRTIAFPNQDSSSTLSNTSNLSIKKQYGNYIPLNILIIDDDDMDVTLTKELFDSESILNKPKIYNDPQEAIKWLAGDDKITDDEFPDIILLDYSMPTLTGIEVLQALRENPKTEKTPIFMLTSTDDDEIILDACKYKATGFLQKPIEVKSFLDQIKELPGSGFILGKRI